VDLALDGRRALVAASSRGLGRAIAEELAAEGCDLMLCARGDGPLERTRATIEDKHGVKVVARRTDLSSAEEAAELAQAALDELGGVDILVTNNGGPPAGPFEDHDLEAWRSAYHQTLESVLVLVRELLPGMKEQKWGRIVNVTSITVKQPVEGLMLSNSLRAAVTGFARTLANEVAASGVTVNNVLPGYTRTDRIEQLARHRAGEEGIQPEDVIDRFAAQVPAGRIGEPRELGALVAFLASDRAGYITAQSIAADGGWIRSLF
jgi:3-oxoacyl-[acyl-carrier protein] reductase